MAEKSSLIARNFYLNEQHELTRGEREGIGRTPKYAPVDWSARGSRISSSLNKVQKVIEESEDPVKSEHFFFLANPAKDVRKISSNRKIAPDGISVERVDFAAAQSRVFGRLNMDLLRVTDDGAAVVHAKPDTFEQLKKTSHALADLGVRDQARWIAFDEFSEIPVDVRIDKSWLQGIAPDESTDSVIEFQPFLSRSEVERLLRRISESLVKGTQRITGTGSDFSGRQWVRGRLLKSSLLDIAEKYF